jgi:hypothetical protein
MILYQCGHCGHIGVRAGNGYAHWCGNCELNDKLTPVEDTEKTRCTVNGNEHLANMEVHEYDGLKFVTESPQPGAIRMTVYRGEETTPLSTEVYGNDYSDYFVAEGM